MYLLMLEWHVGPRDRGDSNANTLFPVWDEVGIKSILHV